MRTSTSAFIFGFLSLACLTLAQESRGGSPDAIPQSHTATRYSAVWGRNPFLIEVNRPPPPPENPFKDWVLTGLTVRVNGETSCFIFNKQTQEIQKVVSKPGANTPDGFVLVQANPSKDPKLASAIVSRNGQTGTLKFASPAEEEPKTTSKPSIRRHILIPTVVQ
jgi:hypothetical protein